MSSMRINLTGVPTTIEVDGKTYRVFFRYDSFVAIMSDKSEVSTISLADLPERIRSWEKADEARKAEERQARQIKKRETEKVPLVWALYGTEKVAVRGRSQKGGRSRWDRKLLITRADGTKETISEHSLSSLNSDVDSITSITEAINVVSLEIDALRKAGSLESILRPLRLETVEVVYNQDSGTFTGTYKHHIVTGNKPSQIEKQLTLLVVADERPWSTSYEDDTKVIPTLDRDNDGYRSLAGYDQAWATKDEAERYADAQNRLTALNAKRQEAKKGFDYDAELEKVEEALAVINGDA